MDAVKINSAAGKALAALADESLSGEETEAALLAAAFLTRRAIEAHQRASIFARVLATFRGGKP